MSEAYNLGTLRGTLVVVRTVVTASLIFQILGTATFFFVFKQDFTWPDALGHSLFHAISSFNNAGFDLMGNFTSMTRYRHDLLLNGVTMVLIVSGGLGFFVLGDIVRNRFKFKKLTVHSKIVLSMTAFLIIFGAVGILMSEHIDVLSALFQSVTARTAGFNTLDTGALSHGGLLLVILLMFVGASPGSTGGGIKTTTTFAIWLSLSSLMFGKQPAAFKRRIPDESLLRAFHVLLLALIAIVAGTLALAMLERDAFRFLDLAFEATSAFATVGLSTGITTQVRDGSKVVLMCLMFAGRLGPITMATLLRTKKPVLRYVEERVFIG